MNRISVCLATYNGEKYIAQQIKSILPQLSEYDEIIISDDHSTDSTIGILESFLDNRIKIFFNSGRGVIKNFENAIIHAKGEYIFLADQDDIWAHNKVTEVIKNFSEGYDVVLTNCELFNDDTGGLIHPSFFKLNRSKPGFINNLISNSYMGCCMAMTNKVKNKILPFPQNIPMHDYWIGIVAEGLFKVKFNEKILLRYRCHNANTSTTGKASKYSFVKKTIFRLQLLFYFLKRLLR